MDARKEILRLTGNDTEQLKLLVSWYKMGLIAISKLEKGTPLTAADENAIEFIKNGIQAVINDCETQPRFVIHKKE